MTLYKNNIASASPGLSTKRNWHPRSLVWIGIAVVVVCLHQLVPSLIWEKWYYKGLFSWIRQSYDFLLGWSPVPMIYFVLTIILVRTAQWFGQWKKAVFLYQGSRAMGGVGALVVLFYMLWGFNYGQISLQEKLGFDLETVTQEDIRQEFVRATAVLKKEAEGLPDYLIQDEAIKSLKIVDHDLRPEVVKALGILHLSNKGRVRVRQLWPNGFLLRWNTAGIYIPQTGEGHIDKGLLSVQKPFTIAHEMAHGYGIADEGACNFIAWLACSQSENQWVRFGGAFTYWRYTAAEMPSDSVSQIMNSLPPVVIRAMTLVRENDLKYPDLMPRIRDAIYSSYLHRHGVKGGLRSYNYVVMMVHQYLEAPSTLDQTK